MSDRRTRSMIDSSTLTSIERNAARRRNKYSSNRSSSQRILKAPIMHLTKRVTELKHNKSTNEKPDHVQAMFAAWNTALVGSSTSSTETSPAKQERIVSSVTSDAAIPIAPSPAAVVSAANDETSLRPRAQTDKLVLDKTARDRLLRIAENAEAEEYAILLRHGKKDGTPGVGVRDMSRSFWTYPNVFSSHEAIAWLLANTKLVSRIQCVNILERMNRMKLIVAAGTSHHVKDKRQFWRFNNRKVARSGGELRRKSKASLKPIRREERARFRPLHSISSVFKNRSKSTVDLDFDDDRSDDDDDDDDDDDFYFSDDDEVQFNPDAAADDWDMCDPDERTRNIFVAEVTKRKYSQGIINYKEMCHVLKQIGVRPPPKEGDGLSTNERVEKSTRQKYAAGIITYDECCHLLRMIGVKKMPARCESEPAALAISVGTDDESTTSSTSRLESIKTLSTGDMIRGIGISPRHVELEGADDRVDDGDSSSSDDLDGSDLEVTDDWDCGLGLSTHGDDLLKTVSIMSSQQMASRVTTKSAGSSGSSSRDAPPKIAEDTGVIGWIKKQKHGGLRAAAESFLKDHVSEQCLEMLIHVATTSKLDDDVFVEFLNALVGETHAPGAVVVRKGQALDGWYLVTSGAVTVKESSVEITLHEGNCFGAPAILNGKNGGLFGGGISVVVADDGEATLAKVPRTEFSAFLRDNAELSKFFSTRVATVIRQRKERRTYQKARRSSMNLARKRQVRGISATAKTTRKAKLTRTLSGHRMVNRYKILQRLGRGSYGDVRKCEDTETGQLFAVKIVNRSQLRGGGGRSAADASQFDQLELEVKILREMRHPNVVLLQEVIDDKALGKLYIIQEFVNNGSIMPETLFTDPLEPRRVWRLFRDTIRGLEYLHKNLIVHRDLKPSNILIDKDDNAKIADFGMAATLKKGDDLAEAETAGSPAFMAPEVCGVCGNEPYSGQRADVWSAGATLYAMVFGHPPYVKPNVTLLEQFEGKLKSLTFPRKPKGLDFDEYAHLRNLLTKMLNPDWHMRLRLEACKTHEYVTKSGTKKLHQLEYDYAEK